MDRVESGLAVVAVTGFFVLIGAMTWLTMFS
jgi:hypothetical protein